MKKYYIVEFISFLLTFIIGTLLLMYPGLGLEDENYLFFIIMMCYGLISYGHYMMIRRKDDYEHLFISLACIIAGCGGVVLHSEKSTLVLPLSLIAWVSMVAVIKLIKIDYYNDRNNPLWIVRTFSFVLFLIIGTLTCINLYYNIEIQSLMLGFFLVCISLLESLDPLVDCLINRKIKKIGKKFVPKIIKENALKDLDKEGAKTSEVKASKKKGSQKQAAAKKQTPKKTTSKKVKTKNGQK